MTTIHGGFVNVGYRTHLMGRHPRVRPDHATLQFSVTTGTIGWLDPMVGFPPLDVSQTDDGAVQSDGLRPIPIVDLDFESELGRVVEIQ